MTERFKLSPLEARTPLWIALSGHLEHRLALLRAQNDSMSLSEAKTAELRGRIAELKGLLTIDQPDRPAG